MSRSYDILLSYSGAQIYFVEHLFAELAQVCGHYSVFFDQVALKHGERVCTTILKYARTCKLAVVLVSEEYFTRSRWPMMELAASYTAAKAGNGTRSLPCLLPVFLALSPKEAMNERRQLVWRKMWQDWELNENMSERSGPIQVQPTVWMEAVDVLFDTRGPIYTPKENEYDPGVFLKKVAQLIARMLDGWNGGCGPSKVLERRRRRNEGEVDTSEDAGVEEDSSENSGMNSGLGSTTSAGKVIDEKETLPEPYRVVVCLEFGITSSSFAYSHINDPEKICRHWDYLGSGKPSYRTVTGIYYSSRDGGQSYEVESWGNPARSSYERGEREAGRASEKFFGIYVTRFNPHLKVRDTQTSPTKKLKLPYILPVDRPINDYLSKFGAYILHELQKIYGRHLTMKMIQWCVPVPSSWDNAAREKMKICMESAGLINGSDGSPYPVKMVGELEAAILWTVKSRKLRRKVGDKLLVVVIGEFFFEVFVHEVVSACNHIHRVKEVHGKIEIPYRECQSLFDPVIEDLLSCISRTYTEVGGVRSLVLAGDWLAASPYVMDNIRRRFSSQVPEIASPPNFNSATCHGAVALAQDLCNGLSCTS